MKQPTVLIVLAAALAVPIARGQQPDAAHDAVDAANRWKVSGYFVK